MRRRLRAACAGLLAAQVGCFTLACSDGDGPHGRDSVDGGSSSVNGGSANGGSVSGGSANGGSVSGGSANGGNTNGGNASGTGGGGGATAGSAGESGASGAGASGSGGAATTCRDDCHYVRADAEGANDGSSWSDAYTELPPTLVRGHVYFVASGSYPGYTFDDAEQSGAVTRVLRATTADHGDADGWRPEYAEGEASFGPLRFESGDYELDGRSAARTVGSFEGTVVRIEADRVAFRGVDVDGAFETSGGVHSAGACTGMSISGDGVVVANNRVHHLADDGVVVSGSADFRFEGNEIAFLFGCGTDQDCGRCDNGHSDGLEIYAVRNGVFLANYAHDIASTSAFFFGNWADELGDGPDDYCEDILLANNVLYNPDTGFVAYVEDARGVRLHHNTIWGRHQGAYGGLAIGVNVTELELVNNVVLSVNFAHLGSSFDAAEHRGEHNLFGKSLGQWQNAASDLVANDPGFGGIPDGDGAKVDGAAPSDFAPVAASPLTGAGSADSRHALPSIDFFGAPRGSPPTIGAIE